MSTRHDGVPGLAAFEQFGASTPGLPVANRFTAVLPKSVPALESPTVNERRMTRTLLVGTGPRAAALARTLALDTRRSLVGAVDSEVRPELAHTVPQVTWLGPMVELAPIAVRLAVDEICVALPLRSRFDDWQVTRAVGRELGIPVTLHIQLDGPEVLVHPVSEGTLVASNRHASSSRRWRRAKRVFDVAVALLALAVFSPMFVLAAIAVKLTSPGPILFRQPRVGRGRRVFGMFKFRTMVQDAERIRAGLKNDAQGIIFKVTDDPRLTRVGPFLRRTSIDELPQLLNVICGDMSLVGPRPLPTWVYEQIDEPRFHRRFSVQAGMTGLWQVHGRPQEYRLMADYDLRYVESWSFWLDLKILLLTVPAVIRRKGAQ